MIFLWTPVSAQFKSKPFTRVSISQSLTVLLSAVWSAEFVTLLLWKLSYVRPSSRGQLGWVRWQRCGQMAALSPSFSSAFLLRPRGQNKSLILLSLAARLPSCMPDTVAVIYTHLYFSVFEHISEHKTCSRTRAHVHIQNSHRALTLTYLFSSAFSDSK